MGKKLVAGQVRMSKLWAKAEVNEQHPRKKQR